MLSKIHITHFRNIHDAVFEFSADTTIVVGNNGTGKTNILEALALASTGKSFKAQKTTEMIQTGESLARVKALVMSDEKAILEVLLTPGILAEGAHIKRVAPKRFMVDGVPKRTVDFVGLLPTVLFLPSHLDLVSGSPTTRRDYLDMVLCQVDREYRRSLLSYTKGVRMRNRILQNIRDEGIPRTQLAFWDQLLIKNGDYIMRTREAFIEHMNASEQILDRTFQVVYDRSSITESRLEQYAHQEVAAGTTLIGPHRDDFQITMKATDGMHDLAAYGSRGEQRMAVLWMKITELTYMTEKLGKTPLLMLDDIFSELDEKHRDTVLEVVAKYQTVITTADENFLVDDTKSKRVYLGRD